MNRTKWFMFLGLLILPLLSSAVTLTVDYSYDNLGRLISANYSTSNSIAYNYDPAGNILSIITQLQDTDGDGIADIIDNCPGLSNADQLNSDDDSMGNICDSDDDNDGVSDLDEYLAGTDPLDDQSNPNAISLALDTEDFDWSTSGDARWVTQNTVYRVGNTALQSGAIANLEQSSVETIVTGPVLVSFYWKVSSESAADFLIFYIDDIEMDSISGEVDWQLKKFNLSPGSHTLRWTYSKDGSNWDGLDSGWLDGVSTKSMTLAPILYLLL